MLAWAAKVLRSNSKGAVAAGYRTTTTFIVVRMTSSQDIPPPHQLHYVSLTTGKTKHTHAHIYTHRAHKRTNILAYRLCLGIGSCIVSKSAISCRSCVFLMSSRLNSTSDILSKIKTSQHRKHTGVLNERNINTTRISVKGFKTFLTKPVVYYTRTYSGVSIYYIMHLTDRKVAMPA